MHINGENGSSISRYKWTYPNHLVAYSFPLS